MSRNKSGRHVDLSGIDIVKIKEWMKNNYQVRTIIICQSIISLHEGNSMADVCKVFGVTRESVRIWKEKLREDGLNGLLKSNKKGKRSMLSEENKKDLKEIILKSPRKKGFKEKKWTGKLIQEIVLKNWNYKISIRTAQLWLTKL